MLGKSDRGMKERAVGNGGGPDHPARAPQGGPGGVPDHLEPEHGFGRKRLPGGEADAMVAEVHGPGVVLADGGRLVRAGDFGKTEEMAAGDAQGAPTVARRLSGSFGLPVLNGQPFVVIAQGVLVGQAIGGHMGFYRQKDAVPDQQ